jgi:protein-S-isoprenylcysteine O-methyltransferase Ste14
VGHVSWAGVGVVAVYLCWGVFIVAWVVGALVNRRSAPPTARRRSWWSVWLVCVVVVELVGLLVPASVWAALTYRAAWLTAVGIVVLAVSLAFTLWARLRLGVMWNSAPTIKTSHELRTDGPYALTRHPIYTGLLGMLVATVLISGLGESLLLVLVLAPLEFKIRIEEQMLIEQFPDAYAAYRTKVPQLLPRLRRRAAAA